MEIKDFADNILRYRKTWNSFIYSLLDPVRAWEVLLMSFIVVNILILSFVAYRYFYQENNISNNTMPVNDQIFLKKIDDSSLTNAIRIFERRAEDFEKIKTDSPKIVDPSM